MLVECIWNLMAQGDPGEGKWRGKWRMVWVASTLTLLRNVMYPALLTLMCTPRLPAVDWTDAPADLNGLVRFTERGKPVSALVPSRFKGTLSSNNTCWSRHMSVLHRLGGLNVYRYIRTLRILYTHTHTHIHIWFLPLSIGRLADSLWWWTVRRGNVNLAVVYLYKLSRMFSGISRVYSQQSEFETDGSRKHSRACK